MFEPNTTRTRPSPHRVLATFTALILALGVGLVPATAASAAASDTATIFQNINAERTAQNAPALQRNPAMDAIAERWVKEMALVKYGSNPDLGSQLPARFKSAVEFTDRYHDSSTIVGAWMSAGQGPTILGEYTDIGIGYYTAFGQNYTYMILADYDPVTPATAADSALILKNTNAARAQYDLPALTRNAAMDAVAQAWAVKMSVDGYKHNAVFHNQIPDGWTQAAENIAMDHNSTTVVEAWLNSPGHRAAIMNTHTHIGIGYYVDQKTGHIFSVQNFATYEPIAVTTAPTISGTAKVGQTLTSSWGVWDVELSYQWKRAGVAIAGANAANYVVTLDDIDKALTVSVTATKPVVPSVTKTSAPTAAVVGATLTAPTPIISGEAKVGGTLTATVGTWGPAPVSLTYQWKRDGVAISGERAGTHKVTADDTGKTLTVSVTGTKIRYANVTKTSVSTARVSTPTLTAPAPSISGTAKVGQTLTAAIGTWGPAPVAVSYQWRRAGVAISGATGKSYVLVAADTGKALTVSVTGVKSGYSSVTKTSATTAAVAAAPPLVLTKAPAPSITGTAKVGQKLTANAGTWAPAPVALSYQWKRSGAVIAGATAKTYALVAADAGKAITVTVTGKKSGYTTAVKSSSATKTVTGTLTKAPVPSISGTAKVGQKLKATAGTWAPAPVTLTYQWKRAGLVIKGATASTFVVRTTDVGSTLTVTVTGRKTSYTSVVKVSAGTAKVVR